MGAATGWTLWSKMRQFFEQWRYFKGGAPKRFLLLLQLLFLVVVVVFFCCRFFFAYFSLGLSARSGASRGARLETGIRKPGAGKWAERCSGLKLRRRIFRSGTESGRK